MSLTCEFYYRVSPSFTITLLTSYRQAIEEVHQNDDNEEDESEEEDVAEGRVEGDVAELKLADEHGEGLDKA